MLNCIVFLNRNYAGNDILKTYSYDLRNREVVNINSNPTITQNMVENILKRKELFDKIKNAQNTFMSFFKYGSKEELQKDFEKFAKKLDNDIKELQKKPMINSIEEYENAFQQIFNKNVQQNKTLKQLTKYELTGLFRTIQQSITYDFYLQPYILHTTNKIIVDAIIDILLNNPELLDSDEILINKIYEFYASAKTNNETVNKLLQSNQEKVKEYIKDFIPKIKTQLIHYRSCLNK